jgi:hypothetical protein
MSDSTLATISDDTRRITGWRRAREIGAGFPAEILSTVSNIAGSLRGVMFSRERSLLKILQDYRGFASNKDVAFSFLRLPSSNCCKNEKNAHDEPIWLKLDETAGTVG